MCVAKNESKLWPSDGALLFDDVTLAVEPGVCSGYDDGVGVGNECTEGVPRCGVSNVAGLSANMRGKNTN